MLNPKPFSIIVPHLIILSTKCYLTNYLHLTHLPYHLVVYWVVRVSKIENNARMRTSSTTIMRKDVFEVDSAVEAQAAVGEDVNPMAFIVTWCVEDRDLRNKLASAKSRDREGQDIHHQLGQSTQ